MASDPRWKPPTLPRLKQQKELIVKKCFSDLSFILVPSHHRTRRPTCCWTCRSERLLEETTSHRTWHWTSWYTCCPTRTYKFPKKSGLNLVFRNSRVVLLFFRIRQRTRSRWDNCWTEDTKRCVLQVLQSPHTAVVILLTSYCWCHTADVILLMSYCCCRTAVVILLMLLDTSNTTTAVPRLVVFTISADNDMLRWKFNR